MKEVLAFGLAFSALIFSLWFSMVGRSGDHPRVPTDIECRDGYLSVVMPDGSRRALYTDVGMPALCRQT